MDLHNKIMNLPAINEPSGGSMAYKLGHRDARHAAAELALKADACIEALRALMRGNEYKTLQSVTAWHTKAMPLDADLDRARKALAALEA